MRRAREAPSPEERRDTESCSSPAFCVVATAVANVRGLWRQGGALSLRRRSREPPRRALHLVWRLARRSGCQGARCPGGRDVGCQAAAGLALQRACFEASHARRQYDAVDPTNRLVAGELERRWNEALQVELDPIGGTTGGWI